MIRTPGKPEKFKGSAPSVSPTATPDGVFSLCSGGVPVQGAFGRLPGKSIRDVGTGMGGAISIFQFGDKIAVQRVTGMEIFDIRDLTPNELDYVYDNQGNLVVDNSGLPVLA